MAKTIEKDEREPCKIKRKKSRRLILLSCILIVCAAGWLFCVLFVDRPIQQDARTGSRANWAKPIDSPGLPNLHKVSEDLYRGAQPSDEGMRQLEKLGVKTVINLRSSHSDHDELEGTGLAYVQIKMTAWNPESEEVVRFLQIVSDSNSTPVFVHCEHGSDRTGLMCAIYRIAVQGWSKNEAIEEMTKGGFGFHEIWMNLPHYIRKLDVNEIKRRAGLNE